MVAVAEYMGTESGKYRARLCGVKQLRVSSAFPGILRENKTIILLSPCENMIGVKLILNQPRNGT